MELPFLQILSSICCWLFCLSLPLLLGLDNISKLFDLYSPSKCQELFLIPWPGVPQKTKIYNCHPHPEHQSQSHAVLLAVSLESVSSHELGSDVCEFFHHDTDPLCSCNSSSLSSAGLSELGPVLGCGPLYLLLSVNE